jgi:hypothetical protein
METTATAKKGFCDKYFASVGISTDDFYTLPQKLLQNRLKMLPSNSFYKK